jgi:chorismate mutase
MTKSQGEELAAGIAQAKYDRNNEIYLCQREMEELLDAMNSLDDSG